MNGETGYNKARIEDLRNEINNTAIKAGENIVEILHTGIIVPISKAWYAPEAVEFFEGFKQQVAATGDAITEAFDGFRQAVQEAGTMWAENTKGEAPSLAPIDKVELDLNVSDILPDNGGDVVIFESEASAVASNLSTVWDEIRSTLSGIAGQLEAETAFIGNGQGQAVQDCFVRLSEAIQRLFDYLAGGAEDTSLASQIYKAVEKYQAVSQDVGSGFNNATFE